MEKIKVKNLAHLKRLMQIGTVFRTPVHNIGLLQPTTA